MTDISKAADDLIVREEVSSKATYEKKYRRPEWPEHSSGVTIGIGYDVGYVKPAQLWADWRGHIPDHMIEALARCCGITGNSAKPLARALRSKVDVPWKAALAVYRNVTIPRYFGMTRRALPNFDRLSPDCKGALTSLVFNRGASFNLLPDRYREMRAIKAHMAARAFDRIPAEFRAMKRLWPGSGLVARREREAVLFERGLAAMMRPLFDDATKHGLAKWEVDALQTRLTDLGFPVGAIDGAMQESTVGALAAFQRYHGLPVTGEYDDATRAALQTAAPRAVSDARAEATAADLRAKGSETIAAADGLGGPFKWLLALAGGKAAEDTGALDAAKNLTDQASMLRDLTDQASGLLSWALQYWWIPAIIIAVLIWQNRKRIVAARVEDHRSGKHVGR